MEELKTLIGMMLISVVLAFIFVDGCDREAVRQREYIQEWRNNNGGEQWK